MKNRLQTIGAIAAITLFSSMAVVERANAATYFYKGSEILSLCESSNTYEANDCLEWLMGVSDTLEAMNSWGSFKDVCVPGGVTAGQLRKVIIQGLNKEPQKLHLSASSLAIPVLANAFPCD